MQKKTILRRIISAALAFLLAFSLLMASVIPALYALTGEKNVRAALEGADYDRRVTEDIKSRFTALSLTTGLGEEVMNAFLDEILTEDLIEKPVFAMIGSESGRPDREALVEDFSARILAYAEKLRAEGELVMTPDQWQETKDGFPSVAGYYIDSVMAAVYLNGLYGVMGTAVSFVKRVLPYLVGAAAIVSLGSMILLIAIRKKRVFPYLYASFVSSGLLSVLASALFLGGEWGMRLGIDPAYLKLYVNEILCAFARCVLICGAVLFAAGIVFLLIELFRGNKRTAQSKTEESKHEQEEQHDQTVSEA